MIDENSNRQRGKRLSRTSTSPDDAGLPRARRGALGGGLAPISKRVSKSMENLGAHLDRGGHPISGDSGLGAGEVDSSASSIARRMKAPSIPTKQFEYTSAEVMAALARQQPVTSVDTKKKTPIGNFEKGGADCRPKGGAWTYMTLMTRNSASRALWLLRFDRQRRLRQRGDHGRAHCIQSTAGANQWDAALSP
jgi:hypothetical protein